MTETIKEIEEFIESWVDNSKKIKKAYVELKKDLEKKEGVFFQFKARPGISYSLRCIHTNQKRNLFVVMDVIDDNPEDRWLSVCFFEEMIKDSEEKGDLIPEGLSGEDGYCFDLDKWDEYDIKYLKDRLEEAYQSALLE